LSLALRSYAGLDFASRIFIRAEFLQGVGKLLAGFNVGFHLADAHSFGICDGLADFAVLDSP